MNQLQAQKNLKLDMRRELADAERKQKSESSDDLTENTLGILITE